MQLSNNLTTIHKFQEDLKKDMEKDWDNMPVNIQNRKRLSAEYDKCVGIIKESELVLEDIKEKYKMYK